MGRAYWTSVEPAAVLACHQQTLKRIQTGPPMNADNTFVFHPRLSAFIGGPNILGSLSAVRVRSIAALFCLVLGCALPSGAAAFPPELDPVDAIRKVFDEKRWQDVVEQAQALPGAGGDVNYYYGVALAQLG